MKIGIISIAYDNFDFDNFYKNMENDFLSNHNKTYYFFTNRTEYIYKNNVNVYYSNKNIGLYTNIKELIQHVTKDNMQLLFFVGINNKIKYKSIELMPEDNTQYSSLTSTNEPQFYNLEALVEHIKDKEDSMIYGSYLDQFINLIYYYSEKEEEALLEQQTIIDNLPEGIFIEESN